MEIFPVEAYCHIHFHVDTDVMVREVGSKPEVNTRLARWYLESKLGKAWRLNLAGPEQRSALL